MKKLVAVSVSMALLSGCDSHPVPQPPVVIQQPQVVQPQVITQPVVVQPQVQYAQPHDTGASAVTSFAAGAALGALAGHVATKEFNKPKTESPAPVTPTLNELPKPAMAAVPQQKLQASSAMDMNKLARPATAAVSQQKVQTASSMDMSKLSAKHSIPSQVTPLPNKKGMDMSKLGRR